ncbi:MAG: hypothetical protein KDD53_09210, partial [Bdellovibrionales bacterium]|nr:hypothetical protein [Bdellovibrionales bacterium]
MKTGPKQQHLIDSEVRLATSAPLEARGKPREMIPCTSQDFISYLDGLMSDPANHDRLPQLARLRSIYQSNNSPRSVGLRSVALPIFDDISVRYTLAPQTQNARWRYDWGGLQGVLSFRPDLKGGGSTIASVTNLFGRARVPDEVLPEHFTVREVGDRYCFDTGGGFTYPALTLQKAELVDLTLTRSSSSLALPTTDTPIARFGVTIFQKNLYGADAITERVLIIYPGYALLAQRESMNIAADCSALHWEGTLSIAPPTIDPS